MVAVVAAKIPESKQRRALKIGARRGSTPRRGILAHTSRPCAGHEHGGRRNTTRTELAANEIVLLPYQKEQKEQLEQLDKLGWKHERTEQAHTSTEPRLGRH